MTFTLPEAMGVAIAGVAVIFWIIFPLLIFLKLGEIDRRISIIEEELRNRD